MMSKRFNNMSCVLFVFLIAISPFIEAASDTEIADTFDINLLPPIVSVFTGYLRWGLFAFAMFFTMYNFKNYWTVIDKKFLLITLFYGVQFCYAATTNTDVWRYLNLMVLSFALPFFTVIVLRDNERNVLSSFQYIVYASVFISIILNIGMIGSGLRFQGFSKNSNLYGITAVFWLVMLLLLGDKPKWKVLNNVAIPMVIVTILLSGSRNALAGAIIVVVFHYKSKIKSLVTPALLLLILCYCLISLLDLHSISDRLMNFNNAIQDSGREEIWQRAYNIINRNLLWGNGMDAHLTQAMAVNVHNCYIRYLLNMGLFFTLFSFVFYIRYLRSILSPTLNNVPGCLVGFIFALTFWNFGEDFFVGLGSSIFVFFTVVTGFISFYSSKKLSAARRINEPPKFSKPMLP